jgi:ribosomal protein S18 acetylase RimI-like enzyme
MNIKLIPANVDHVRAIKPWFPDQHSCAIWAGPNFRFPFTEATFIEDTRLDFPSYVLIDDQDEVVAFGQYYVRNDRCHLARLVVSPRHRGRGLGSRLIVELAKAGFAELRLEEGSLFVLTDNLPAFRLYEKLGFEIRPYPSMSELGLEGAVYMVAPMKTLTSSQP